ncbi:hypothetical protein BST61_g8817 [Cercospora zeina]
MPLISAIDLLHSSTFLYDSEKEYAQVERKPSVYPGTSTCIKYVASELLLVYFMGWRTREERAHEIGEGRARSTIVVPLSRFKFGQDHIARDFKDNICNEELRRNGVLVGIHAKVIGHASILAFPIFVRSMYDSRYMTHNVGSRKTSIFRTKVFSYTALSEFLFMWPV